MSEKHTEIHREMKTGNYSIISNEVLRRSDLSWKAKGIMVYILSLPDDWKIYLEEIQKHATDGKASFRTGWNELKEKGYISRHPVREGNRIKSWRTVVRESVGYEEEATSQEPPKKEAAEAEEDNSLLPDFQQVENEEVENQEVGNEEVENRKLLSTYSTKDLKELSTEGTNYYYNNAMQFYEHNGYGTLSPLTIEKIGGWIEDLTKTGVSEEEANAVICKAMEFGVINNKRSWGYVNRILVDWEQRGLNTIDKIEAAEKQREESKTKKPTPARGNYKKQHIRKETLPDWAKGDQPKKEENPVNAEVEEEFKKRLEKIRAYKKEGQQ